MDKVPFSVAEQDAAIDGFVKCAMSAGYCHDSGRSHFAEAIQEDLAAMFAMMGHTEVERQRRIVELCLHHESPWVQYYAAAIVLRFEPASALPVLDQLAQLPQGMVAVVANQALAYLRDKRH